MKCFVPWNNICIIIVDNLRSIFNWKNNFMKQKCKISEHGPAAGTGPVKE